MGIFSRIFGDRDRRAAGTLRPAQPEPSGAYEVADVYRGLREQVLGLAGDPTFAPGDGPAAVLMETGFPGAAVSLAAIADGTTSLYFSNGGGVIGAGAHEPVRAAASRFLAAAAGAADGLRPAGAFPLPEPGRVRFYLVAADGIRAAEAAEEELGSHRHPLSPLFHLGHAVISAIREHTPEQA
jgi:hypothetical protein